VTDFGLRIEGINNLTAVWRACLNFAKTSVSDESSLLALPLKTVLSETPIIPTCRMPATAVVGRSNKSGNTESNL
jgi:hypothetical protein